MCPKSRKVQGYIKAVLHARRLRARYRAKMEAMQPLIEKLDRAEGAVAARAVRLTGGQRGEAEQLLKEIDP